MKHFEKGRLYKWGDKTLECAYIEGFNQYVGFYDIVNNERISDRNYQCPIHLYNDCDYAIFEEGILLSANDEITIKDKFKVTKNYYVTLNGDIVINPVQCIHCDDSTVSFNFNNELIKINSCMIVANKITFGIKYDKGKEVAELYCNEGTYRIEA